MGKARDYIPALKYGHKIMPEDIAGMLGLPHVGSIFYVDPTAGSDTANAGKSQNDAFATATAAEDACTSGQHDVVIIAPTGGTGRTAETAAIVWDKRFTHLIGSAAPASIGIRAGIGFGSAVVSPCITFSNNGGIVKNLTIAQFNDVNVLSYITGNENYFGNVHFQGIGHATTGDDAAGRCISMVGAEENLFEDCTIGLDTIARSTTNASLELASASTRNIFRGCRFPIYADNAGALFVKAASAADIDRFVLFQDCMFHNAAYSAATTMTTGFSIHAAVGGSDILDGCSILGVTDWSTDYTAVTGCNMPDITAANAGFMETIAT